MTIQNNTERMLEPYIESVEPASYLTSFFSVPTNGMHNSDKISVDVRADDNDTAFPVSDNGWHMNERDDFDNKEFTPAIFKEGFRISAKDLMQNRSIGDNPFVDPVFGTRAVDEINRLSIKCQKKIKNGMELMASQIFTTGQIALYDNVNKLKFSETFGALSTHFPNATTAWSTSATAVPLTDAKNLCDVIVADGRRIPRRWIMNSSTFDEMMSCTTVIAALNAEIRLWKGEFGPQPVGTDTRGAVKQGTLKCGPYVLEIWTYDASYKKPYGGAQTKFIPDGKWIIESGGRMDATFGGLANFGTDGRASRYFTRVSNAGMLADMSIVTWIEPDGTSMGIGAGTRPLLIPVAVNTFGCGDADAA